MSNDKDCSWVSIDSQEHLEEKCSDWMKASVLAIDTEFMRTNTFYPKLGLLQLADGDDISLIDPLEIVDWACFKEVLGNTDCEVVMHSAGEDLTVFQATFQQLPCKLFDTQIAAAYLDKGFSLSYQALVKEIVGPEIPKDETRSDWLRRPLSGAQLQYAALDVEYLLQIKQQLETALQEQGMYEWFAEDSAQLLRIAESQEDVSQWQHFYDKVSNAWRLNTPEIANLQRLCFWREKEARRRDKPRSWIAKDAELLEIAQVFAKDENLQLANWNQVTSVSKGFVKHNGARLIEFLRQPPILDPVESSRLSPPLPPQQRNSLKQLKQSVVSKSEELGIAPELLARKRWLTELLQSALNSDNPEWPTSMQGWRQELLGPDFAPILMRK